MAYAAVTYVGNGATTQFAVPFPYRDSADILVEVGGVITPFTLVNPSTIAVTSAPGTGVSVEVRRETSPGARVVDYASGASLDEGTLDADSLQAFYLAQEALDAAERAATPTPALDAAVSSAAGYANSAAGSAAAAAISAGAAAASAASVAGYAPLAGATFTGNVQAPTVMVGEVTHELALDVSDGAGAAALSEWRHDTNDLVRYRRSNNRWEFVRGGATVATLNDEGITLSGGSVFASGPNPNLFTGLISCAEAVQTSKNLVSWRYGLDGGVVLQRGNGLAGAETQVLAGERIGYLLGSAYGSGAPGAYGDVAGISFYAAENNTTTARGSYITFETTPIGGSTRGEAVRIDAAKNFGIGCAPRYRWHTVGASAAYAAGTTGIATISTGTGVSGDDELRFGLVDGAYAWVQAIKIGTGYPGLVLQPAGGRVGIGTTTPGYTVDVGGTLNATEIRVGGVVLSAGTGSNWTVSGADVYRGAGTVGIGTTPSAYRLDVAGTVNATEYRIGGVVVSSASIRGELTSGNVTTALGFTPYNATNPAGYITGITGGMVTAALGYTPYNSSNPSAYITAATATLTGDKLINGGLTLTGTASSRALQITQAVGAAVSSNLYNEINLTETNANVGLNIMNGFRLNHTVTGTSTTGARHAFESWLDHQTASSGANPYRYYCAGAFVGRSVLGDGGTSGVGNAKGAYYGLNSIVVLEAGATYVDNAASIEVNTNLKAGSSVAYKAGIQIAGMDTDAANGSVYDAMLSLSGIVGSTNWTHGILVSAANGKMPLGSTGTVLGTLGAGTFKYGIDFGSVQFTDFQYLGPGFSVRGNGAMSVNSAAITADWAGFLYNQANAAAAKGLLVQTTWGANTGTILEATVNGRSNPSLRIDGDSANPVWITVNSTFRKVEVGVADSAGSGYRTLRVLN